MRRSREVLERVPFARNDYGSIVQTRHPGAHDAEYRARVETLVRESQRAWPQVPRYTYRPEEDEVWRFVSDILVRIQDRYACRAYLEGRELLDLPLERVPQMDEVSAVLERQTGFMLAPVGGLLDGGEFLSTLAHQVMRCTPYVRHPSHPFFTPEPDILHELRGHAPMFLHAPFVELSVEIGRAAAAAIEAEDRAWLDLIGLFYWYTIEYGLVREDGEPKVFGAGNNGGVQDLLRSVDPTVEKRPLSLEALRELTIDYDAPQRVFFVAESFEQVADLARELTRPSPSGVRRSR